MSQAEPQYLYRYRHLQGNHCKYTSRILTDSILYFAPPTSFNDPLDCKVHFQSSLRKRDLCEYYTVLLNSKLPQLNRAQRRAKITQDLKNLDRDKLLEGISRDLQDNVDRLGVLTLSASDRNILLWSHYAASHSGLCLQFLATEHPAFFGRAQCVRYLGEYPEVDLLQDSPEQHTTSFLLSKALDWEYEEEWRIIDTNGHGERVFPEELLVGVILGSRMPPEDKKYVVNLIGQRKSQVEIYEASVSKGSYSLDIKPYEA